MTLTYDLEVVTTATPTDVVAELFRSVKVRPQFAQYDGITEAVTPLFDVTAFGGATDALSEDLGIYPSVFIEFRPRPHHDADVMAFRKLLHATVNWMTTHGEDMALIKNGEMVLLYRRNGRVVLNNAATNEWTPQRLSLLDINYDTVYMPAI